MVAMVIIFAIVYPETISRVGLNYNDTILVPSEENGNMIYSRKMNGRQAYFIVTEDKAIEFYYEDKFMVFIQ